MRLVPERPMNAPSRESPRVPMAYLIAVAAAVVVYFVASGIETLILSTLRPSEIELEWISDVILAVAFGSATYLWLHLKWTRLALSRLEREHIVLDTQLSIAAQIQRSLLPPAPGGTRGVHWGARLEPAGRIGGDLYDFVERAPRSWLVLVGDVSGKGIPAALVQASIRTRFRTIAEETSDPGDLASRISQALYADNGGAPYLTCFIARLDVETRELTYANAGHPAALVLDSCQGFRRELLESSGPPAGLLPGQTYASRTIPLPRGAVTIVVTDGITEAFDELGLSGTDEIASLVAQLPHPAEPDRICEALMARTAPALAPNGSGWQDDRTVVALVLED